MKALNILIIIVLIATLLLGCNRTPKDSFQVKKNDPAEQKLPPNHPDISQMQQQQQQPGMGGSEIPPPPSAPQDGGIDLPALEKALPKNVKKGSPSSSMRLAQYQLVRQGGDSDDGEMALFYLGSNAGSIDANIERWKGQFTERKDESTAKLTSSGKLPVTITELAGTLNQSAMMSGATGTKEKWRLWAAIVETQAGPYFFKAVGPEKTMKAHRDALKSWILKANASGSTAIGMH
ncbi:MAG: hypothetical protein OEM52_00085 [bacterium]|nr:hypothetical protein [bacterium]